MENFYYFIINEFSLEIRPYESAQRVVVGAQFQVEAMASPALFRPSICSASPPPVP